MNGGDRRLQAALCNLQSDCASWRDLHTYSKRSHKIASNAEYQYFVSLFDPDLTFPQGEVTSINSDGFGSDNLNRYRIINRYEKPPLFEKIYHSGAESLAVARWINANVVPGLREYGWSSPKIVDIRTGKRLTAVYYEFVEGERWPREKALQGSMDIIAALPHVVHGCRESFPCDRFTIEKHSLFSEGMRAIAEALEKAGYADGEDMIRADVALLNSANSVFCHGDMYQKNMMTPRIIIDWDRGGFYPAGFDLAHCLSKTATMDCPNSFLGQVETLLASAGLKNIDANRLLLMTSFLYARKTNRHRTAGQWLALYLQSRSRLWREVDGSPL